MSCDDEPLHHVRRRRRPDARAARRRGAAALALCEDDDGARSDGRDRARRRRSRPATRCSSTPARPWRASRGGRMRFVDEFRDAELGPRAGRRDPRHRRAGPPLQAHGGLRRPHALDLQVRGRRPAAGERRARARPRLPGLRDPDGPRRRRDRDGPRARRDLHLLRRHDARPRLERHAASRPRPRAPTCGWSTRRSTRCGSPSSTPTARSSSSRSASRRPRRRPR